MSLVTRIGDGRIHDDNTVSVVIAPTHNTISLFVEATSDGDVTALSNLTYDIAISHPSADFKMVAKNVDSLSMINKPLVGIEPNTTTVAHIDVATANDFNFYDGVRYTFSFNTSSLVGLTTLTVWLQTSSNLTTVEVLGE